MALTETTIDEKESGLGSGSAGLVLPVFTLTIFLSAFLLFSVQPMFAKMVLPKLGGSPGVWSVAMVFFQTMLLAGYGYAHFLTKRLPLISASIVHLGVLLAAFIFLPLALPSGWDAAPQAGEAFWLLGLFGAAVGLPFFAVAANGPLLQAWFSRTGHEHADDPYFLYGASNIGSFASLILYIVALEPALTLSDQTFSWAAGFALLTGLIAICAFVAISRSSDRRKAASTAVVTKASDASASPWKQRAQWTALAFVPSGLLVAVTAHISTDIAAAPFMWVIPLALFLLTFVLAFARKPFFSLPVLSNITLALSVIPFINLLFGVVFLPWLMFAGHLAFFFFAALLAHSFLVKLRPEADDLTSFYLWMSFGGVLGGATTTLLSPVLFDTVVEYPLLVLTALLCRPSIYETNGKPKFGIPSQALLLGAMICIFALSSAIGSHRKFEFAERSFFGSVTVRKDNNGAFNLMKHGSTVHGAMRRSDLEKGPTWRPQPLTYYHASSAIAHSLFAKQDQLAGKPAEMGVAGLGTGSILCHRKPGERWTSYEIDKVVVDVASDPKLFRYVSACGEGDPIVIGDARLTLAKEPAGKFDYLLVDAFSSDSIPTHLLTVEAFQLYRDKLADGGMLAVHISNRYMELGSVLAAIAKETGLVGRIATIQPSDEEQKTEWASRSTVVVLARDEAALVDLADRDEWKNINAGETVAWTDDYSNIPAAIYRFLTR